MDATGFAAVLDAAAASGVTLELLATSPPERVLALCKTCGDTGLIDVPVRDDVEDRPCPVCFPWSGGFPGMAGVLEAAGPGQAARRVVR